MHKVFAITLIAVVIFLVGSQCALAQHLIPVGGENKARGMPSTLSAQRGSAVLYNPANLSLHPSRRAYIDAGFAVVSYAYEHRLYDPVVINNRTPVVAVGWSGQVAEDLTIGLVALPLRRGGQTIPGVPRSVVGIYMPFEIESEENSYQLGVGAAYKISEDFRVGVALHNLDEHRSVRASAIVGGIEVLNYDVRHRSYRMQLGWRFQQPWWAVAGSFSPGLSKRYSGEITSLQRPETTAEDLRNFEATQFSLSGLLRWEGFSVQADTNYYAQPPVEDAYFMGQGNPELADLKAALHYGLSARIHTSAKVNVILAWASLPSLWGAGRLAEGAEPGLVGNDFGLLEGIDRQSFAVGTQILLGSKARCEIGLMHSSGERIHQAGEPGEGRYQLAVTVASAGFSIGL